MSGKGLAFVTFDRPIQAKPLTFLLYNNCFRCSNNNNNNRNNKKKILIIIRKRIIKII